MKLKSCPIALGLIAGLLGSSAAVADPQYASDRDYCMSSGNQESRRLCLKEAAAAQSERRREGTGKRSAMRHESGAQESSSGTSGSDPKEQVRGAAQKTKGFTHRQLEKARRFGARHNPAGTVNEPDKAPAALGK